MKSRWIGLHHGLTYHVLEWAGPADVTTTYVLVHGFLDFAYGWHEVAALLAEHHHVIALDLRGHGDSDWIGAGGYYHFLDYVADLDEVIARLARQQVVVVGHSMGGSIAAYWAGTRPTRPAAIALLEGLGPSDQSALDLADRTATWIDSWRTARARWKPMPSIDAAVARLRAHDPLLEAPLARRLAIEGTRPSDAGWVWKFDPLHLTMGPYPFRCDAAAHFWRRITCPVLVVDGAKSTINLPETERAARRAHFAAARVETLPESGHMMARHQPAPLAALLLDIAP